MKNSSQHVHKSDPNNYSDVEAQIENLKTDIQVKDIHILHLETMLNDVIPLRKHFKRQVRLRMKSLDSKLAHRFGKNEIYEPTVININKGLSQTDLLELAQKTDKQNFESYEASFERALSLRAYIKFKKILLWPLHKLSRLIG